MLPVSLDCHVLIAPSNFSLINERNILYFKKNVFLSFVPKSIKVTNARGKENFIFKNNYII